MAAKKPTTKAKAKAPASKTPETISAEQELAALRAQLAAAQAQLPQLQHPIATQVAQATPVYPQQQQNYRPNKMNNIIVGSLMEGPGGIMKGSFDAEQFIAAIQQALTLTTEPGRVRIQILRKKKDGSNAPFMTVGGVGQFGGGGQQRPQYNGGNNYGPSSGGFGGNTAVHSGNEWK